MTWPIAWTHDRWDARSRRSITCDVRSLLLLILVMGFFSAGVMLGGLVAFGLWAMAAAAFLLALD